MTDFTAQDRKAVADSISKALTSDQPDVQAAAADVAAAGGRPKEFFCENWPTVKAGLEVLRDLVPLPIKAIIGIVIRAGDAAAAVICTG